MKGRAFAWRVLKVAFAGALPGALLGMLLGEFILWRVKALSSFIYKSEPEYNQVVLLAYRVKPAGIYIKYKNTGDQTIRYVSLTRLLHERSCAHAISASAAVCSAAEVSAQRIRALLKVTLRRAERRILSKSFSGRTRRSPKGSPRGFTPSGGYCTMVRAISGLKVKLYEKGELVEEVEDYYSEIVLPHETTEGIFQPEKFEGEHLLPVTLAGRQVKVICDGALTE